MKASKHFVEKGEELMKQADMAQESCDWWVKEVEASLQKLEEWVIRALTHLGLDSHRHQDYAGVWTSASTNNAEKIASLGVRIRQGVSYHGVSINISPDLDAFKGIIPCGIVEANITSLSALGYSSSMSDLDSALYMEFRNVFN